MSPPSDHMQNELLPVNWTKLSPGWAIQANELSVKIFHKW